MAKFHAADFQALLSDLHAQADADRVRRQEAKKAGTAIGKGGGWMSIRPEQGRLLYLLLRQKNAKLAVEFGTSFGVSGLYLAAALSETGGRLITCEFLPEKAEKAGAHFARGGVSNVIEVRVGDVRETLADAPAGIDVLFLDGDKSLYLRLFEQLQDKLQDGALLIADNADAAGCQDYVRAMQSRFTSVMLFDGRMLLTEYRAG